MPKIDIDPKYRLGVDAIDSEHAVLIKIASDLKATLAEAKPGHIDGIPIIVDRLISYAQTHFGHEEQLMAEHRYPRIEEHKAKHKELMQLVAKFAADLAEHPGKVALQINLFMTVWLFEHITQDDAAFAKHYLERHSTP